MNANANIQSKETPQLETIRNLLITYAYNIIGSCEDAKDIVQDAYLKFSTMDTSAVEDKRAYIIRTVINLSINFKNRQKKLLEHYKGEWLPEPIATEHADAPINRKEILSYSLMVLLEKLNAKQRAVFILKEAFDYDHKEIAAVLDTTAENSRKLFSRAKMELKNTGSTGGEKVSSDYLDKYLQAIGNADTAQLEKLLQQDIVLISDGGGKVAAALQPVHGKLPAAKFLHGIYKKFYAGNAIQTKQTYINHQPALLYYHNGQLTNCQVFEFEKGHISRIYFIRNPDKLQSL